MTETTTPTTRLSLVHRLRLPAQPAPGPNGRHPGLIALHGRGSDDGDLIGLAPYLDERLLWVSPRAPLYLEGGFEWYRLASIGVPEQPTFEAALGTLERFIDEVLEAYPIDPQRLYLLGFSQGGMMAYAYTLTHPERVAGVIAHSSYLPLQTLEAAGPVDAAGLAGKPLIIVHGTKDSLLPVRWAREARDYFTAAGATLQYHEFPMGHNVSDRSMAVIDAWLQQHLDKANEHG